MDPRTKAYRGEIEAARARIARGEPEAAVHHLERAHILGQLRFADHVRTHVVMLRLAWSRRDAREVRGQVVRLLASVPGHLFGWIPIGNTGGADVSALKPMPVPVPADLAPHFAGFDLKRQVLRQVAILVVIAAAAAWAWAAI